MPRRTARIVVAHLVGEKSLELGNPFIYDQKFQTADGGFTIRVTPDFFATLSFFGKGGMDITHALIAMLEEVAAMVPGQEPKLRAIVNLGDLKGSPLRAQLLLGKWLFTRKDVAKKIAIYGGNPVEVKFTKAVMAIARMDRVGFFATEDEARRWLMVT